MMSRRPPEPPPPDPGRQRQEAQLAQEAAEVAARLRDFVDHAAALNWQPDGYDHHKLRHVADSIHGMALRAAMSSDDLQVLNAISGRTWTRLHPFPEGEDQ